MQNQVSKKYSNRSYFVTYGSKYNNTLA